VPQPVRKKSLRLEFNPRAVAMRADLCVKIVTIGSMWSIIEDALATIFAHVTEIEPAVAAHILYAVPGIHTRLQMIESAIDALVSAEALEIFRALMPEIKSRAVERNTLMHADWRVHEAYPNSLIWRRQLGNPIGRADVYQMKDFEEIERRMDQLLSSVQEFEQSVRLDWYPRDPERRKSYWRLIERSDDPGAPADHPSLRTDPSKSPPPGPYRKPAKP
jgi:hypothetical protein